MNNEGKNGGQMPLLGTAVGGKGADGKFYFLAVGSSGGMAASGSVADNSPSVDNPQIVGGVARTAASYAPAYTNGDVAALAVDKDSGGLLCHTRKLTRTDDAVSADPKQFSTVSTATPITADGTVFTLAAGEKGVIQNLDDAAVYVKLGASASSSSFNFILPACQTANDGNVPPIEIDDYVGAVSIAAATGSPRVSAYKLS
jgi:hypothetical protein